MVRTIIFIEGYRVLTAIQVPASRVPPPTGTMIASIPSNWSMISNPMVPCPHTTSGLLFLSKSKKNELKNDNICMHVV